MIRGGSLDHLVGAGEKWERDGEAECLGSLEVQEQLDFRGLLDWHISRFLTLENPVRVDADLARKVRVGEP